MAATPLHISFDLPPAFFPQWQWEEAINQLRNQAEPAILARQWAATGQPVVDARARAHIAEWATLDRGQTLSIDKEETIFESLVRQALRGQTWDLYTVESVGDGEMSVRGLRDQRGYRIRWIEGREMPEQDELLGLRLLYLDPPGHYACTLPLRFGDKAQGAEVLEALLRSFGRSGAKSWGEYMSGDGARLLLEYGLAALELRAARPEKSESMQMQVEDAFRQLEAAMREDSQAVADMVALSDGRLAWVEERQIGVHLRIFDSFESWQSFRLAGKLSDVGWLRARRVCPEELHPVEWILGAGADEEGLLRLERRDCRGIFVDPDQEDLQALLEACERLVEQDLVQAA